MSIITNLVKLRVILPLVRQVIVSGNFSKNTERNVSQKSKKNNIASTLKYR